MKNRAVRVPILLIWCALGLTLILVPWSAIWESNSYLYQFPALALFLENPYLRGAVSGLGFMNVLLALEAFRHPPAGVPSRT
jgi:hypothetical protein